MDFLTDDGFTVGFQSGINPQICSLPARVPFGSLDLGLPNLGAIFLRKKKRLRQRTHKLGASKIWGPFFCEKKRLRQRTHELRASKNLGAIFLCAILSKFFYAGPPQGFSDLYSRISQQRPYCMSRRDMKLLA